MATHSIAIPTVGDLVATPWPAFLAATFQLSVFTSVKHLKSIFLAFSIF